MKPGPLAVDVSGATGPQTGISAHSPRWAWLVSGTAGVLCIALTAAGLVIGGTGSLPWMPGLVVSIAVATLLVARRPSNPISWILLASALLGSVAAFGFAFEHVDDVPAIGLWAAWLGNAVVVVNTIGLTGAALLLFPDGSLPSLRWRWFARGLWTVIAFCAVSFALLPGRAHPRSGVITRPRIRGTGAGSTRGHRSRPRPLNIASPRPRARRPAVRGTCTLERIDRSLASRWSRSASMPCSATVR